MCLFDCCIEKEKKNNNEYDELNNIMQQIYLIRQNTQKKLTNIIEKTIAKNNTKKI